MTEVSAGHEKYLELLPWYARGTLGDRDRETLRAHLGHCLTCKAALNEERRLSALVSQDDPMPLERRHGINALLERIDRKHRPGRIRFAIGRRTTGYALAAALGGVVVWSLFALPGTLRDGPEVPAFATLSSGAETAPNRIDVVFAGPIDESGLERFLADLGGVLVSGPSDLGRYTIEVEIGTERNVAEIIESLRQDERVRFAGRTFTAEEAANGSAP